MAVVSRRRLEYFRCLFDEGAVPWNESSCYYYCCCYVCRAKRRGRWESVQDGHQRGCVLMVGNVDLVSS